MQAISLGGWFGMGGKDDGKSDTTKGKLDNSQTRSFKVYCVTCLFINHRHIQLLPQLLPETNFKA